MNSLHRKLVPESISAHLLETGGLISFYLN